MIPKEVKQKLEKLDRMRKCEVCAMPNVEWNHSLIYSRKQLQEVYAIRALCVRHHRGNNGTIDREADLVNKINAISEGLKHLKANYPKCDWEQELIRYKRELSDLKEKQMETLRAKLNGYI